MGKIIFLNGPSSSGKSTLAKALQNDLQEPYLYFQMDQLIEMMPDKINDWTGGEAPLGFSWKKEEVEDHPVLELQMGPFAKKFANTMKSIGALLASQGYNIIIDVVAFGKSDIDEWRELLQDQEVLFVGVKTPLAVLVEREKSRGDRLLGGARGQYLRVHQGVDYDLEIDTHHQSLIENIQKIKAKL